MVTALHERLVAALPQGRHLPEEVWNRRHRAVLRVAAAQAVGLGAMALLLGRSSPTALLLALAVASPLVSTVLPRAGRGLRSAAATASLLTASVVLVHLMGGLTEAHFHFFVMIGLAALYQNWVPFGMALAVVLGHHGVVGTLFPPAVVGHADAQPSPWTCTLVHGAFVMAASLAHLAAWRLNEQQGLRDPLTGLANRTLLLETTARMLAQRPDPTSVLLLDLDDFKDVNDSRGHAVGDQLLSTVGRRIQGCVRSVDQVARLGGDEFAVVVAGSARIAAEVGERVLAALADPVVVDGRALHVRVSIGVADSTSVGDHSAGTLLRNADLAMYLAKSSGKNRVVVYAEGMERAAQTKAELITDLDSAVAEGQFAVHYQPTVELSEGVTTGYEALLRWQHPTRGLVPPLEFIPLAEESGAIVEIGRWVLTEATRQAAQWSRQAGRPIDVAVNLSPRQLLDDDVAAAVRAALDASGLPAGQLTLEVTEGVLIDDVEAVVDTLRALRLLGVRIAIDDFGTGYSSLSYLRRLPADVVKIDRSFVQDLGTGGRSTTLVASIIELARSLHLEVVAEGVETEEQHAVLGRLACSHAQGYLFGRPQPAAVQQPAAAVPVPQPRTEATLAARP
ncbi:putative bifunctional diguanylate cyclase/phosphodiesterase [Geodermatophilus obscurus]|uniref:Diguanylate cyclase/phosphodiesterase n=1 Tax=Geodermatophilus obscurus (strain ATCC 25078 / DSM 43160 / JCM 3152 / CCUG 61914 / KCC A-0152 / KCTC 9177 / NBRC 13315 / NRRL B-3577 / G-20) TaxID=526225 RepID=D2SDN4_GEOOG|nr:EAL domain-containing protein [Geodermatophilus obscurus]ADB74487.1 diguanylate cyclase/phosphodiesterase [Geodermatophilus obscurus DSM 43160]